jgi:hypothetical protein
MAGTAPAGPRLRAVAVGLALALVVLVVVGRLQQHLLAPQPAVPARPLTVAPTTTIPPVPVVARIRLGVDADVEALAAAPGGLWALGGRDLVRVDPGTNRVVARTRVSRRAAFYGSGLVAGPARSGSGPVSGRSGSMPGRAG